MSQLLESLLSPKRAEQCQQADAELMAGLGQTIAAAIAPRNSGALSPAPIRLAQYEAALKRFDWTWEYAEGNAWRKGRDGLLRLRAEQAAVDPSGDLWRKHAPVEYHNHLTAGA